MEEAGHKLLIVPATLLHGELGASFLDRASFRVRTAASAAEAVAIARAWAPALVVIGADLEDTPAAALANRIRREVDPGIKLLLITDVIAPDPAGEDLAADAHLVEPVDPDNLLLAMAELLEVRARRAPRVAVRILARLGGLIDEPGRETALTNLLSLSESGARLEAPGPLRLGGEGTLQFVLPDLGYQVALKVRARVLIDEIRLHYGVSFEDVDDEARARLQEFVAARLGRQQRGEEAIHEFDRD